MTGTFAYTLETPAPHSLGLVVLQSDETVEQDFRRLMPQSVNLHISRVPSGLEVAPDSLQQMDAQLPQAAGLLPRGPAFAAVGYACTSGTAQIGADRIRALVQRGVQTPHVTEPVSALLAACEALDVKRLAILSPYIASVSARLRDVLATSGIETLVFGTFDEAEEHKVSRIDARSIHAAATKLIAQGGVDAIFLSCTNLRTLEVIDPLEAKTGLPVLTSNQVLAWHMAWLAGCPLGSERPGRLLK